MKSEVKRYRNVSSQICVETIPADKNRVARSKGEDKSTNRTNALISKWEGENKSLRSYQIAWLKKSLPVQIQSVRTIPVGCQHSHPGSPWKITKVATHEAALKDV